MVATIAVYFKCTEWPLACHVSFIAQANSAAASTLTFTVGMVLFTCQVKHFPILIVGRQCRGFQAYVYYVWHEVDGAFRPEWRRVCFRI